MADRRDVPAAGSGFGPGLDRPRALPRAAGRAVTRTERVLAAAGSVRHGWMSETFAAVVFDVSAAEIRCAL